MATKSKKEKPIDKKANANKSDVDYIGNELVKVSNRINELELSLDSLRRDIKRVMGRMGL